jgi:hypothetical protein
MHTRMYTATPTCPPHTQMRRECSLQRRRERYDRCTDERVHPRRHITAFCAMIPFTVILTHLLSLTLTLTLVHLYQRHRLLCHLLPSNALLPSTSPSHKQPTQLRPSPQTNLNHNSNNHNHNNSHNNSHNNTHSLTIHIHTTSPI